MKEFIHENIKFIHGDCMDIMAETPDNYYDLCICDPPYGLGLKFIDNGVHGHKQRNKRGNKKYNSLHNTSKDWNNNIPLPEYFKELHRISIHQIIWGVNYYAKYIPAVGRIVHDKQMGIEGTKINFSHADIASCSMQNRVTIFRYRWSGNKQGESINWNNTGDDARIHPTQKPIALYKWLLKNYVKETDRIIDTHLGSGSSAIAAWEYKCKEFIGIEIDKEYYDAAIKRFKNHVAQKKLF